MTVESPALAEPGVVNPAVEAVELADRLTLIRDQLRRAFAPGEPVHLDGTVPPGCDPRLRVDGELVGEVATDQAGDFAIDVDTSDLSPGQHLAEIVCDDGTVLETGFWVAATQTSSNTLSVALVALVVLGALGRVGLGGLIGSARARP